jgi:hypothetical protein
VPAAFTPQPVLSAQPSLQSFVCFPIHGRYRVYSPALFNESEPRGLKRSSKCYVDPAIHWYGHAAICASTAVNGGAAVLV